MRGAGKWVLEVVRHVNVGHDVIRPTTHQLSGRRAISAYFEGNAHEALLGKATQKLMQTEPGLEPRSYSAAGAEWRVNSLPPPAGAGLESYRPAAPDRALGTQVDALRTRIVLLAAVQAGFSARLERLEGKVEGSAPAGARVRDASAVAQLLRGPASAGDSAELPPPVPAAPAAVRQPAPSKGTSPAPAAPLVQESPPAAAAVAETPEPEWIDLQLPDASALGQCIVMLVGADASAKEAAPLAVNRLSKNCYAAAILDDLDRTVGLILMDVKATVYLGGTLMMLPKPELDQQVKAANPGEDSIAASAEICNALSGEINGAQDQHVRIGAFEKFDVKQWSWLTAPAARRDLEDGFGGRTIVFSRPRPMQSR
jgi:hypothetical protein